jgi:SAM-dependent methyltransferase
MISETCKHSAVLAPWCQGIGADLGFGGDPIVPHAITFDLPTPYARVGRERQILRGDARDLSMFCDSALDFVYQSHLIEDFDFPDIKRIVQEVHRVLCPGGRFVCCNPDEELYREHCRRLGERPNEHHRHADFSLVMFERFIEEFFPGQWRIRLREELSRDYSFLLVLEKR